MERDMLLGRGVRATVGVIAAAGRVPALRTRLDGHNHPLSHGRVASVRCLSRSAAPPSAVRHVMGRCWRALCGPWW